MKIWLPTLLPNSLLPPSLGPRKEGVDHLLLPFSCTSTTCLSTTHFVRYCSCIHVTRRVLSRCTISCCISPKSLWVEDESFSLCGRNCFLCMCYEPAFQRPLIASHREHAKGCLPPSTFCPSSAYMLSIYLNRIYHHPNPGPQWQMSGSVCLWR